MSGKIEDVIDGNLEYLEHCQTLGAIVPRCTNHTLNTPGMDNPKLDLERKENAEMRLIKEC